MFEAVEFTDRYGGWVPSGITGCHDCEAMGVYPVAPAGPIDHGAGDWTFAICTACNGTGRVPLWRGLLRVPGLWVKAARFVWHSRTFYGPRRPTAAEWWLAIRIAFLYDWLLLHPRTARWAR